MEQLSTCKRCGADVRDGVRCSSCQGFFDFPCSGITEAGYRKLGDRKATWRCSSCKGTSSPLPVGTRSGLNSPAPADMESISRDLKILSTQMASLPILITTVKAIQEDVADLKTMKSDIAALKLIKKDVEEVKVSVEFAHNSIDALTSTVEAVSSEVQGLLKTKEVVHRLEQRSAQIDLAIREQEQRSRLNNIEIKGVPLSNSENLYEILDKIGVHIKCSIPKEQINYIARIPSRNDRKNKNILVGVTNRYIKENFVAAAKKSTIVPADLGLRGDMKIYVNDHLTQENKVLLTKVKALAKERGFAFVWVKGCKILLRKNPTSHVITIRNESDLKLVS